MTAPPDPEQALRTLDAELARGLSLFAEARTIEELELAEISVLGRKAPFSGVQRSLGELSQEDRRPVGQRTNEVREALQSALGERRAALELQRERSFLE